MKKLIVAATALFALILATSAAQAKHPIPLKAPCKQAGAGTIKLPRGHDIWPLL